MNLMGRSIAAATPTDESTWVDLASVQAGEFMDALADEIGE